MATANRSDAFSVGYFGLLRFLHRHDRTFTVTVAFTAAAWGAWLVQFTPESAIGQSFLAQLGSHLLQSAGHLPQYRQAHPRPPIDHLGHRPWLRQLHFDPSFSVLAFERPTAAIVEVLPIALRWALQSAATGPHHRLPNQYLPADHRFPHQFNHFRLIPQLHILHPVPAYSPKHLWALKASLLGSGMCRDSFRIPLVNRLLKAISHAHLDHRHRATACLPRLPHHFLADFHHLLPILRLRRRGGCPRPQCYHYRPRHHHPASGTSVTLAEGTHKPLHPVTKTVLRFDRHLLVRCDAFGKTC